MENLLYELDKKKEELDNFLDLIDFISTSKTIINENEQHLHIISNLVTTSKGMVYLILYNLVESSMREAVLTIHDKISDTDSKFDNLRNNLKKQILIRARKDKVAIDNMLYNIHGNISAKFHSASLKPKDLFSGNIDRDEVKSIASIYGFSDTTEYTKTKHGENLRTVKDNRNDLAHGNKNFSTVGATLTPEELRVFSNEVVSYIYEITDNISDCVDNKTYLQENEDQIPT